MMIDCVYHSNAIGLYWVAQLQKEQADITNYKHTYSGLLQWQFRFGLKRNSNEEVVHSTLQTIEWEEEGTNRQKTRLLQLSSSSQSSQRRHIVKTEEKFHDIVYNTHPEILKCTQCSTVGWFLTSRPTLCCN